MSSSRRRKASTPVRKSKVSGEAEERGGGAEEFLPDETSLSHPPPDASAEWPCKHCGVICESVQEFSRHKCSASLLVRKKIRLVENGQRSHVDDEEEESPSAIYADELVCHQGNSNQVPGLELGLGSSVVVSVEKTPDFVAGKRQCRYCPAVFDGLNSLKEHVSQRHVRKLVPASGCLRNQSTPSTSLSDLSVNTDHGTKNLSTTPGISVYQGSRRKCYCGFTCATSEELARHNDTVHPQCPECHQKFPSRLSLDRHKFIAHQVATQQFQNSSEKVGVVSVTEDNDEPDISTIKRKRGRPPKRKSGHDPSVPVKLEPISPPMAASVSPEPKRNKGGRPRKNRAETVKVGEATSPASDAKKLSPISAKKDFSSPKLKLNSPESAGASSDKGALSPTLKTCQCGYVPKSAKDAKRHPNRDHPKCTECATTFYTIEDLENHNIVAHRTEGLSADEVGRLMNEYVESSVFKPIREGPAKSPAKKRNASKGQEKSEQVKTGSARKPVRTSSSGEDVESSIGTSVAASPQGHVTSDALGKSSDRDDDDELPLATISRQSRETAETPSIGRPKRSAKKRDSSTSITCSECSEALGSVQALTRHLVMKHPDALMEAEEDRQGRTGEAQRGSAKRPEKRGEKISSGKKVEGTASSLNTPQIIAPGSASKRFDCRLCGLGFVGPASLNLHFRKVHFSCVDCSRVFSTKQEYVDHRIQKPNYACEECRRRFHGFNMFTLHMWTVHKKARTDLDVLNAKPLPDRILADLEGASRLSPSAKIRNVTIGYGDNLKGTQKSDARNAAPTRVMLYSQKSSGTKSTPMKLVVVPRGTTQAPFADIVKQAKHREEAEAAVKQSNTGLSGVKVVEPEESPAGSASAEPSLRRSSRKNKGKVKFGDSQRQTDKSSKAANRKADTPDKPVKKEPQFYHYKQDGNCFVCDLCDEEFAHYHQLVDHLQIEHRVKAANLFLPKSSVK